MDFRTTIDLIIKDLDEVREIIDDLKKYPGVPVLQIEFAKSKCKSASEVIALIKNLKDILPVEKEDPARQKITDHQVLKELKISSDKIKGTNLTSENESVESEPADAAKAPAVKKDDSKKISKKTKESAILADNFSHMSSRINEQLGSLKNEDDVSEILKTKRLSNLSEAIGVNDKFLFIREIFDGNKDLYNQTIKRLDEAVSLSDAMAIITGYAGEGDENDALIQLLELVKRRNFRQMGKLFLVPTPVGNLKDITLRALEILGGVDMILAEDTRHTRKLLTHYNIKTRLQSHHKFNEHRSVEAICSRILEGTTIALVSDAGTPGISDPGYMLVRTCLENGITVETLPGATAFIPALINSGLPCDRFCFEGFLPVKKGRKKRLSELKDESRTIIFYESPYRLVKTLLELAILFGPDREASVSREISKIFEENIRGSLSYLSDYYTNKPPKGEVVIIVSGVKSKSNIPKLLPGNYKTAIC